MTDSNQTTERLQKAMARFGISSRRHAEKLISQGLVKVNGSIVKEQGTKVTPEDIIEVKGTIINEAGTKAYILLNKPLGVITSVRDPQNRKTVIDLIKTDNNQRVYPVGRLDFDTSGLLLLTNDGELTYRLTHPSYSVDKIYRVWAEGSISEVSLEALRKGVQLEDGITLPAKINIVRQGKKGKQPAIVEITIHEGRNRQVRRMFEHIGSKVMGLERIAFGPLRLDEGLKAGRYRQLTESEVLALRKQVGLKD